MKRNSIKSIGLSVALALSISLPAEACFPPPIGVATTWLPPALAPFKAIDASFSAYENVTSKAITAGFANIQNSAVDANLSTVKAMMKAAQEKTANRYKIAATSQELQMDFDKKIAVTEDRVQNELIPLSLSSSNKLMIDQGGSASNVPSSTFNYFKGMCRAHKIGVATVSPDIALDQQYQSRMDDSTLERQTAATGLSADLMLDSVKAHYKKYCDENSLSMGFCSSLSKIPNADVLSFVFLHPMNTDEKRIIPDISYATRFTYSPYEQEAAKVYIEHLVPSIQLPKLNSSYIKDTKNAVGVARYKQLSAASNIARFNVQMAYKNRVSINNGISRFDSINMMIEDAKGKGLQSVKDASLKGKKVYLLSQANLTAYLQNELSRYESQRNDLLATYLAVKASSPDVLATVRDK
ncbi:hypothetical protein [Photobacterium kishitanii]|uniref:TolC family protein n=1 Tax=Photobacterium kishitanii TaxID=318456 RepID=A0A2T3KAY6_9GAMM|nr:hypothetical protein [Photobacterium kishitanii]PSU89774.1 hypothetical protein C9J27_24135 [Photobacterium kishitanii]